MDKRFALAFALLAVTLTLVLGAVFASAAESRADAACDADDDCMVGGVGEAILGSRLTIAAIAVGLSAGAAFMWAFARPAPSA